MLIARFLINVFGIFIFLFIFWKKMKDDFGSEVIFKSASYILFGILFFYLLSFNFLKAWFLWFTFFGGVLGLLFAVFAQRIKFYEGIEAFIVSALPWVALVFLNDSVINSSFNSFVAFLFTLFMIFGSYYIDANYKSFGWYKSGKIGITGIIVLSVIFLTRSIVAFIEVDMLSFVGRLEIVISLLGLVISLVMVYLLNRNEK